jgi:hypothetical protein
MFLLYSSSAALVWGLKEWFDFALFVSFTLVIPHYWINCLLFLQLMAHPVWELFVGLPKCHFSSHQDKPRITFRIASFFEYVEFDFGLKVLFLSHQAVNK